MKHRAFSMSTPSKFIPLQRLLQIKKDNYLGEMGKDYCPFEVEELIIEKKNRLAESQVREVIRWERAHDALKDYNLQNLIPAVPEIKEVQFMVRF